MKKFAMALAGLLFMASPALAVTDSAGITGDQGVSFGDVVYSSSWERIKNKPSVFPTNWSSVDNKPNYFPTRWNDITGRPSSFPPAPHNHDDRYIRRGASGNISGDLGVTGTITGNRLVTGEVGGERWCRATTAGRIQCTHSAPTSSTKAILDGVPDVILCGQTTFQIREVNNDRIRYMACGTGKTARCGSVDFKRDAKGTHSGTNRKGAFSSDLGVCKNGLRAASQAGLTNTPFKAYSP